MATLVALGLIDGARRGRCDREHDSKPDRDDDADRQPDSWDVVEHARLPQRHAGADEKHEVTDEVELQKLHAGLQSMKGAQPSRPRPEKAEGVQKKA